MCIYLQANWRFGRFLKPATVKSWAVFYMNPLFERDVRLIFAQSPHFIPLETLPETEYFRDFVHNLVLTAKDKGVQISLPNIVSLIEPTNNAIEQEMEKAFKRKMQFVMLVAGTDSDIYHGNLFDMISFCALNRPPLAPVATMYSLNVALWVAIELRR
jgi:hypothetical protein